MSATAVQIRRAARVLAEHPNAEAILTDAERERWQQKERSSDRADFLAAHLLMRALVARIYGQEIAQVRLRQRCPLCGGPHGRPEVDGCPQAQLSMAHSGGFIAVAVGKLRCGVDVEALPAQIPDIALHPREQQELVTLPETERGFRAAQFWVRKEALVKAGAFSLDDLQHVEVREPGLFRLDGQSWTVRDIPVRGNAVAALAVRSR